MNFLEKLKGLAEKASRIGPLETEEATKNALVMPFIAALGYDVFDPNEVVPEFTADVGIKKGEKVDYAIRVGEKIVILVEAKKYGVDLATAHASQLYRYFSVTTARIGLLTNGRVYRFYSDLEEPNKMDNKPFLEIDLLDLRDALTGEMQKLTKEYFNLDEMLASANELKYMAEIRKAFARQLEEPDEEFVRFFFSQANSAGRFGQSQKELFAKLVKQTLLQTINERVSDRLRSALKSEDTTPPPAETVEDALPEGVQAIDGDIETTDEELEGFRIVKAIACGAISPERITYRDGKTYFAILIDNNNRRTLCRLWFNASKNYLGIIDESKKETRFALDKVEDIYNLREQILLSAQRYAMPEASASGRGEASVGESLPGSATG